MGSWYVNTVVYNITRHVHWRTGHPPRTFSLSTPSRYPKYELEIIGLYDSTESTTHPDTLRVLRDRVQDGDSTHSPRFDLSQPNPCGYTSMGSLPMFMVGTTPVFRQESDDPVTRSHVVSTEMVRFLGCTSFSPPGPRCRMFHYHPG